MEVTATNQEGSTSIPVTIKPINRQKVAALQILNSADSASDIMDYLNSLDQGQTFFRMLSYQPIPGTFNKEGIELLEGRQSDFALIFVSAMNTNANFLDSDEIEKYSN